METHGQILKKTGLFDSLTSEELEALAKTAWHITMPAGEDFIREGDVGNELYILTEGTVQVYTIASDGQEVVLNSLSEGAYIGEQALLPGTPNHRNASVRAFTDVELLRITKANFQNVLDKDNPLKEKLLELGQTQVRDNLVKQSAIFRSIHVTGEGEWYHPVKYDDNHIIFRQGDTRGDYYFITSGRVAIYREEEGSQKLLATLEKGQGFGELALLQLGPRRATAITQGKVEALVIEGDRFRELYQRNTELRDYLQTLRKVYTLEAKGFMTQHTGKFMDQDAVTTLYHMLNGSVIIASHVVGQNIFNMTVAGTEDQQTETIAFADSQHGIERELVITPDKHVLSVTAHGLWEDLGKVHSLILDNKPIQPEQLQTFRQEGVLEKRDDIHVREESDIVCDCMQMSYGVLYQTIRQGCRTVEEVADKTGATTVCGSCIAQVKEMVGDGSWIPVMVAEEFEVVKGIRSFRFAPYGSSFNEALPGQHVVVQAYIDGRWVQRPYTISSAANETAFREITVKREPMGYFSNWIFDQRQNDTLIRISEPQGDYYAEFAEKRPIICMVGGIGVTPALAMMRSIIREGSNQTLYIDYSVTSSDQFVYVDELEKASDDHDNIHINLRATQETGRITHEDIGKLVAQHPGAQYFICGPGPYQTAVAEHLVANHVPNEDIEIEEFTPVGAPATAASGQSVGLLSGRRYIYVGAALMIAFLLQDFLQLKWPWLEATQAIEGYKRWSGVVLLLYVGLQWYLTFLRATGRIKKAAAQYNWHKQQGAFAPLIYYFHSTRFGYAYMLILSLSYFATVVAGFFNQDVITKTEIKKQYTFYWILSHVVVSILLTVLAIYHVYIVFAYK